MGKASFYTEAVRAARIRWANQVRRQLALWHPDLLAMVGGP